MLLSSMAFAGTLDFTQTNNSSQIPCSGSSPCGTFTTTNGTGAFAGDVVFTVDLSLIGNLQFDKLGFNGDLSFGDLSLLCFNFGSACSSGVGGASLNGSGQEDGFGKFDYTLLTGLDGGSGCGSNGSGCKLLFTFVIGDSQGSISTSDFTNAAGHVANGSYSGYIATGDAPSTPEPSSLLLLGSGILLVGFRLRAIWR